MVAFIVLYTFDYTGDNVSLKYLEVSIGSVFSECSNVLVLVYTTTPDYLKHLETNNQQGSQVKVVIFDPETFGQKTIESQISHFRRIGHARMYLIPYLLEIYKIPVVYLDNDTYINDGKEMSEYIANSEHVSGYCEEPLNFYFLYTHTFIKVDFKTDYQGTVCDATCSGEASPCSGEASTCSGEASTCSGEASPIKVDFNTKCVNNGVQIFPYNEFCLNFAKRALSVYKTLYNLDNSNHFNDMFAFSLVWRNTPNCKTIANYFDFPFDVHSLEYVVLGLSQSRQLPIDIPFDPLFLRAKHYRNPFIIHYCYQKYYNGDIIKQIMSNTVNDSVKQLKMIQSLFPETIEKPTVIKSADPQTVASIRILYTFDFTGNRDSLNYLEASIISVILKCPSTTEILVYTMTKSELLYLETKFDNRVTVVLYDPERFGQKALNSNKAHFRHIGHSRIYIIPHLLEQNSKGLVYLDNDTYVTDGTALCKYANGDRVVGYCEEQMNLYYNSVHNFSDTPYKTDYDGTVVDLDTRVIGTDNVDPDNIVTLDTVIDTIKIDFGEKCVNNGVQIYPNNETSILFSQRVKKVYEKLCELDNENHWHDMFAFSLVWQYMKTKCDALTESTYGFPVDLFSLEFHLFCQKTSLEKALIQTTFKSDHPDALDICVIHYCYVKINHGKVINFVIKDLIDKYNDSKKMSIPFV